MTTAESDVIVPAACALQSNPFTNHYYHGQDFRRSPHSRKSIHHWLLNYFTHLACLQVAILFPPAAAGMVTGCSCDLLINICLTMCVTNDFLASVPSKSSFIRYSLGYIPGHIHAFWLIYKQIQAEERYGSGGFQCKYYHNLRFWAVKIDLYSSRCGQRAIRASIPGHRPTTTTGAVLRCDRQWSVESIFCALLATWGIVYTSRICFDQLFLSNVWFSLDFAFSCKACV